MLKMLEMSLKAAFYRDLEVQNSSKVRVPPLLQQESLLLPPRQHLEVGRKMVEERMRLLQLCNQTPKPPRELRLMKLKQLPKPRLHQPDDRV